MSMTRKRSNAQREFMPVFVLLAITISLTSSSSHALSEAEILMKFKNTISNTTSLTDWKIDPTGLGPCTGDVPHWIGIRCSNGSVSSLILENMTLQGVLDMDTLSGLSRLRVLSFMNNSFLGPMPEVNKIAALKRLYLSMNGFSGEIRDDVFLGMNYLKKVYLARNDFSGRIPKSLVDLPRLLELSVEGNRFDGEIPEFRQEELDVVNFANNQFVGLIPFSLSNISAASFFGNKGLCGKPLEPCKIPPTPTPKPTPKPKPKSRPSMLMIAIIASTSVTLLLVMIALCFTLRNPKSKKFDEKDPSTKMAKKTSSTSSYGSSKRRSISSPHKLAHSGEYKKLDSGEQGRLFFVKNGVERFELQDLLRASAEVLGSGSFGSSYKAVLMSGPSMVVKRFRQMSNVGKDVFHDHMKRLGRLSHPNLLPLVAFYYKKEEKLLLSDFVENGSLASHLHGKRATGESGLDWPTRLKIIKGVTKGLAYLYKELPNLTLSHGHLKSSNVLLDGTFEPLLMDYAMVPIMDQDHAQQFMVAYKSPEFTQNDRVTKKTDVWCLGILILEMLTGKFPANFLKQGKGNNADLTAWVDSVVREEWTSEVFDKDMKWTTNGQGEMLKLLKIGVDCCEWSLEKRCDLKDVAEKVEELKEGDSEEDGYSSYNMNSFSRAVSEDDLPFKGGF